MMKLRILNMNGFLDVVNACRGAVYVVAAGGQKRDIRGKRGVPALSAGGTPARRRQPVPDAGRPPAVGLHGRGLLVHRGISGLPPAAGAVQKTRTGTVRVFPRLDWKNRENGGIIVCARQTAAVCFPERATDAEQQLFDRMGPDAGADLVFPAIIIGNLFQQTYTMADSAIVGRYVGEGALAAVGASYSLTNIFICVAIGGGIGRVGHRQPVFRRAAVCQDENRGCTPRSRSFWRSACCSAASGWRSAGRSWRRSTRRRMCSIWPRNT